MFSIQVITHGLATSTLPVYSIEVKNHTPPDLMETQFAFSYHLLVICMHIKFFNVLVYIT